jgi:hypothetical protein
MVGRVCRLRVGLAGRAGTAAGPRRSRKAVHPGGSFGPAMAKYPLLLDKFGAVILGPWLLVCLGRRPYGARSARMPRTSGPACGQKAARHEEYA